jgi:hypothetical protein
MIRRRRLRITPGPARTFPDPEDPSLPQISPSKSDPDLEPPRPPALPTEPPPTPDDPDDRSAAPAGVWMRIDDDERFTRRGAQDNLWTLLRARVDAAAALRRTRLPAPL